MLKMLLSNLGALWILCCCVSELSQANAPSSDDDPSSATPAAFDDKTLVAWVTLPHLEQRSVSLLTLENPPGQFDGIVFGELATRKWMAGSDYFLRTQKQQEHFQTESETGRSIQIAISYRGKHVEIVRDGTVIAQYEMEHDPIQFNPASHILFGLHHMDAVGAPCLLGSIDDARVYATALTAEQLAELRPNRPSTIAPLAWWDFESGEPCDLMGSFPLGQLCGSAVIENGQLELRGGFMAVGVDVLKGHSRAQEDWPSYHLTARPEEGFCRPYDANGCIYWNGRYHLMYIFQDRQRPMEGHSWGHASSPDLVNWTFHPPTLVPNSGDPDRGIFSGNAFINRDGVPMLCWFGIDAGVCVATATDDDLLHWEKHPNNPIIPMPKEGEANFGRYQVWDPYLWLEGDTYYCLLGGNKLEDGEDTLYALKSPDLVNWEPLHPFYQAEPTWTVAGEDCSCPDFFRLGDKHVLLSISHSVGSRCYVGEMRDERFYPAQHVRMNWPGANFFAPESLLAPDDRRIFWGWVTDPRLVTTQYATGSGFQSLPRVLSLSSQGNLEIRPVDELQTLRGQHRHVNELPLPSGTDQNLEGIAGDRIELLIEIDPNNVRGGVNIDTGGAREVGVKLRCSPDSQEETVVIYDPVSQLLKLDMSRSTLRDDVLYQYHPLDMGNHRQLRHGAPHPRPVVEAPLVLGAKETLKLHIFLDGPMLEVFANDRQCITQQIYPQRRDSLQVRAFAHGGNARVVAVDAWDMRAARFELDESF